MKKIGFTIGKFAPLHKGHQYLIETALKEMDEFYVVVYDTNLINITLEQRAKWIQKLYPTVKILFAKNPPSQYGLDEESVKIQINYLKNIIKNIKVTHFYSSEKYGKFVARDFNIINRVVDLHRDYIHISATDIRSNIDKYTNFLEENVLIDLKNKDYI
ncbi:MAG: adenylyltransferase/cytidyltransferase family protein [Clostridia bacterium]|nr:adenylyltransferase/cytidyltransferase family protein [Clostridia bacterium]